jgi:hypothetical protein
MSRSPSAPTPRANRAAATASRSCHRPLSAGPSGHRPGDSRPRERCRRARQRSRENAPAVEQRSLGLPVIALIVGPEQKEPLTCTDQRQHTHSWSLTSACGGRGEIAFRSTPSSSGPRSCRYPPDPKHDGVHATCPSVRLRTRPHSMRTPSAVVNRPANTNAVWRNDASRSNGSSAEIASHGITTA